MLRLASLLPLLAIGALGCVETPDAELGATEQAIIICPEWECGSNSPVIATYGFHELNINGYPNDQGFSVMSLYQAGINYHLYVERGRIIGRTSSLTIAGSSLVGAQIRLRLGTKIYAIRIDAVLTTQSFAKLGGTSRPIETYALNVNELVNGLPARDWVPLCSNAPSRTSPDVLGMNVYHSLVFEGERIDALHKSISTALDSTWFNIGCAGHAIAKMALNAYTQAAHDAFGFQTTIPERQTFLKMVTADYCGNGTPFTVAGEPLQWMDWRGYTQYLSSPANLALEARWTANGAVCLDTPRINANPTPLGDSTFQGLVMSEIAATCAVPPPCAGSVTTFDSTTLLSANPI